MFVAFVSFVLTDRSARRFFYFYLFYLLFDLSIICSFVYRRFLSFFVSSRSSSLCPVFRVLIRFSICPSIRPLVALVVLPLVGFSYKFYSSMLIGLFS